MNVVVRCCIVLSFAAAALALQFNDCLQISEFLFQEKSTGVGNKTKILHNLANFCISKSLNCTVWLQFFDPVYDVLQKADSTASISLKSKSSWIFNGDLNETGLGFALVNSVVNGTTHFSTRMKNDFDIDFEVKTLNRIYEGLTYHCTRYPFNERNGFDISGNGRGCNEETAIVTVHTYSPDVVSFEFEQCCECDVSDPAHNEDTILYGSIYYTTNVPLAVFCNHINYNLTSTSTTATISYW